LRSHNLTEATAGNRPADLPLLRHHHHAGLVVNWMELILGSTASLFQLSTYTSGSAAAEDAHADERTDAFDITAPAPRSWASSVADGQQ
jgi:hypothetical protein